MTTLKRYAAFGKGFSGEGTLEECEKWIANNGEGRLYRLADDAARVEHRLTMAVKLLTRVYNELNGDEMDEVRGVLLQEIQEFMCVRGCAT